jgi:hypothetical protein
VARALIDRATLASAIDRPVSPPDDPVGASGTFAHDPAGGPHVDLTLEGRTLQDALRAAIAHRRGYCWWDVDRDPVGVPGWVVTLDRPERQEF